MVGHGVEKPAHRDTKFRDNVSHRRKIRIIKFISLRFRVSCAHLSTCFEFTSARNRENIKFAHRLINRNSNVYKW